MEARIHHPALTAATPAALQPPVLTAAATQRLLQRASDAFNSVLFFGLLGFGVAFPFVATIYALIVL